MSRFFTSGDSSSESSSSDEEELYSGEEQEEEEVADSSSEEDDDDDDSSSDDDVGKGASRFLRDAASDSDSEDEDAPKPVRSAKHKRLEELEGVIKLIDNARKINDWSTISEQFDKLNRQVAKISAGADKPPKQYIQTIAELEDFMNDTIAKQKVTPKKMNATNAKGLNAMKQKVKKNNKDYTIEIDKYREDQLEYMISDEEEDEPAASTARSSKNPNRGTQPTEEDDAGFSTVGASGKILRYAPESILAHLRTFNEARGKKNTDRAGQIQVMEKLLSIATTSYQKIRVLLSLIATRFDLTSGSTTNYMPQEQWKS